MRQVIGCVSILSLFVSLVGCGQTGALVLPSQVQQDKPASYLLYSSKKHADSSVVPSSTASHQQSAASEPSVSP